MVGEFRHLLGNFSIKTSGELGWWLDMAFSEMRKIVPCLCAAADLIKNENLIMRGQEENFWKALCE